MKQTLILAALGLVIATQTFAAAEPVATLKTIRGTAVIERAGRPTPANAGDPLYEQDRLKTGPGTYVGLGFTDQSLLSVGPKSEIDLTKYRFDRTTHQGEQTVTVKSGSLSAISGKIAKASPEQVRFNTGTVTLGVRGTMFLIDLAYAGPCTVNQYWKAAQDVPILTADGSCVAMTAVDKHSSNSVLNRFYLLPDRDGRVGAINLSTDDGVMAVDKAYAGGEVGAQQPLRKLESTAETVNREYGPLLSALPVRSRTFTLKFDAGLASQLTPDSMRILQELQQVVKDWPGVADVDIVGHTDTVGPEHDNDLLSIKRAESIRIHLIGQGIAPERLQASGRGERQLQVQTDDGVAEEANRRVEITIY